jgi:adenine-specific DNA-methyltransferase
LVSRFAIDADLKQALKKSKWTIDSYRIAVDTYRNAESKEQKREMERLIADIKSDFRSEISLNDPKVKKLRKLSGDLYQMTNQGQLFEMSKKEKADWNKKVTQLTEETKKLEAEIEEIKANKIFENAFEWRFEFPEVLNDDGDFVGFDVVIGNPPYLSYYSGMAVSVDPKEYEYYIQNFDFIINKKAKNRISTVMLFLELSTRLLRLKGEFANIIDINIFSPAFETIRKYLVENIALNKIVTNLSVFEGVGSGQVLLFYKNEIIENNEFKYKFDIDGEPQKVQQKEIKQDNHYNFQFDINSDLVNKIKGEHATLDSCCYLISGMNIGGVKDYFLSETKVDETYHTAILSGNIFRYIIDYPNEVQRRNPRNNFIRFDKDIEKHIWDNKIGTPSIGADDSKFKKEKLLIRRPLTGDGKLAAAYSNNFDHYSDVTVYIINETILPLKFLLGLINSKLATWYCRKSGIIRFEKGQQPQITITKFKDFPVPNSEKNIIEEITEKVNHRIISFDKNQIENIEKQIDLLVYKLYDLTEEEIKIIENN